jgi:SAM-dependent methyltransferase
MSLSSWTRGGDYFDSVASLYGSRRPDFPAEVLAEIAGLTGLTPQSSVAEVGAGTGQATLPLANLGPSVLALEPGAALARHAAQRLSAFPNVEIVQSRFEEWDPGNRRFDAVLAASSWHWIDPTLRWRKAHEVLVSQGWLVLANHVVIRQPGQPEVYAETADLHEAHVSGHPSWGNPPTADEVIASAQAKAASLVNLERVIGRAPDPSPTEELFEPPLLRWYRQEQNFDAHGYVEHMRTTSLYGRLDANIREPLLTQMEERIRFRMGDRATRRYLICVRLARRNEWQ